MARLARQLPLLCATVCALSPCMVAVPAFAETQSSLTFTTTPARLPRVYRGASREFTLELTGPVGATCALEARPVLIPSGARAAGILASVAPAEVLLDADGAATVTGDVTTDLRSYLGDASFEVVARIGTEVEAVAVVNLLVTQRKLVAPEPLDFGEVHFRGTSRATLRLELWSPVGASAWLDWGDLAESSGGEILAAFVTPEKRSIELAPDGATEVAISVRVPRGARAGEYTGSLDVQAGPHQVVVPMVVRVVPPSLAVSPERLDLGDVYGGADGKLDFEIALTGSVAESIEIGLAGPLVKLTRAAARLEPMVVGLADESREITPDEPARAQVSIEVPPAQEDGDYSGELIVRAGAARAVVPVRVNVPRPSSLPAFEVSQLELTIATTSDAEGVGAVTLHSNLDQEIAVEARISSAVPESWDVAIGDADASADGSAVSVPPRGSVEVAVHAVLTDAKRAAKASIISVEFEYDTELVRTDVTLERVLRKAPVRSKRVRGRGRAVVVMLMLVGSIVLAVGWRRRPVRYAAASTIVHLFFLTFGLSAPFRVSAGARPPQEKTYSIQVIQLDDPFGEQLASLAESALLESEGEAEAAQGEHADETTGPSEATATMRSALARPTSLVPSDPEAPRRDGSRETPEIARAPASIAGPRRAAPSEGFDDDGPDALVSTLAQGTLQRARMSGDETFGALASDFRPGAVTRGAPVLIEDIPDDAIAGPDLEQATQRRDSPTRVRSALVNPLRRDLPTDDAAPTAAAPGRAQFSRAKGTSAGTTDRATSIPTFVRGAVREDLERVTVQSDRPPAEAPAPTTIARASVATGTEGRRVTRVDGPRREFPRRDMEAPPTSLVRRRADVDVPTDLHAITRRRQLREKIDVAKPTPEPVTEEEGVQTITRARGRSPAGQPGRVQESFARVAPRRLSSSLPGASIARSGRTPASEIPASRGSATIGRVRSVSGETIFGVLKHDGDWNVTPRAIGVLARELPQRHPGFPMVPRVLPLKPSDDTIFRCAVLYVTGKRSPATSPAAARRVGTYLDRGGFLWIDDAASPGDNTFDRSARAWLTGLVPGATLRRIPVSHEIYSASYDLVNGYARHTPPAGAWTRQGELTGLFAKSGRLIALYSRNGYGRAIQIDPLSPDVISPPRGLTPRECREGALRMAVNVVVHALKSSGQAVSGGPTSRPDDDPAARYRYRGKPLEVDRAFLEAAKWQELKDGAPTFPTGSSGILSLKIGSSEADVAGLTRACPPHVAASRAIVMDVTSALLSSAQLAIRLRSTDGTAYESVPLYLRPGANENLRVPLDGVDFRSTRTGWKKYDTSLDRSAGFSSLSIILYGRDVAGALRIARWRVEGWAPGR